MKTPIYLGLFELLGLSSRTLKFQELDLVVKKVFLAIALASSIGLSGCATGFNAATNTQGNSGNGRTANVDNIQIRNAVIVVDAEDPTRATLIATVRNVGEATETLKSIEMDPAITVTMEEIELAKGSAVSIGYNSDVKVALTSVGKSLIAGQWTDVKFVFGSNEPIQMSLIVKPNKDYYADVEIPEVEVTPSPAPSAS